MAEVVAVVGGKQAADALRRFPVEAIREIAGALLVVGEKVRGRAALNLRSAGKIFSGQTANSLRVTRPEIAPPAIRASVVASARQSAVIEKGRTPGKKMPPEAPIERWVKRKGVHEGAQFSIRTRRRLKTGSAKTRAAVARAVYLIRRKIAVKGIPPSPFLEPAAGPEASNELAREAESAVRRAAMRAAG